MTDLSFGVTPGWHGQPADGEGVCIIGIKRLSYSAPAEMGGLGYGANPETLLLSAVGSCYSITLSRIFKNADLPFSRIHVTADGSVIGFPREMQFTTISVHPEIRDCRPEPGRGVRAGGAARPRPLLHRKRCARQPGLHGRRGEVD